MIDMHCHLDLYPNPHHIAEQCHSKGIYVLSVTTTPKAWDGTTALAEGYTKIRTALGLHPQLAHERHHELDLFDVLLPNAKYVGEIGLDGGDNYRKHYEKQRLVFRHILKSVSNAGGRVMTIHSRNAASDVLNELVQYPNAGTAILHWFTGTKTELKRAVDLGCWFSVNPTMLATKRGADLVKEIPKERLLPETDGPFAKLNKRVLMPWDTDLVTKQLSEILSQDVEVVWHQIESNFRNLVTLLQ